MATSPNTSINPLSEAELDEVYERFEEYSRMQHPLHWSHVIVGRILATLRISRIELANRVAEAVNAAISDDGLERALDQSALIREYEAAFTLIGVALRKADKRSREGHYNGRIDTADIWEIIQAAVVKPKPEEGVLCTDCDKIITDVKRIVIKGDRAVHFDCPASERHGLLGPRRGKTCISRAHTNPDFTCPDCE